QPLPRLVAPRCVAMSRATEGFSARTTFLRTAAVQTPAGRAEVVSGGFVPGRADGGSNKPARLLERRGDLFVGDLLLEGFAGGDEVEVSLVHQDLGGEVAGVVAAGHGEAV